VLLSFFQFDILRTYDLVLSCLKFRTLYYGRHLGALLLINVSQGKINFYSTMDTVGIRMSTSEIKHFPLLAWAVH
jgi:hypothetical protein